MVVPVRLSSIRRERLRLEPPRMGDSVWLLLAWQHYAPIIISGNRLVIWSRRTPSSL